nr:MBOAT family O-acyltransferase [Shewanella dokdonensis]
MAGPILRSHQLIPQLKCIKVTKDSIIYNIPLFAVGMIKKVLIADQLASYIDPIFLAPQNYHTYDLVIAAVGFTIQIYCDFSAYSDMAIATAGMLGIRFPENFHSPYLAYSLTETWKRWHMTLSFWLRDYVFIPLVRYCRNSLRYLPIFLTMLISGLWHGASWNFVLWGGIQGGIMMFESYIGYAKLINRYPYLKPISIALNFFLWSTLLILFRCSSISVATDYYHQLFYINEFQIDSMHWEVISLSLITLLLHNIDRVNEIRHYFSKVTPVLIVPIASIVILGCAMVAAQRPESFYYFDF